MFITFPFILLGFFAPIGLVSIAGSIHDSGWVKDMVKLIIAFASLTVPLIEPMLISSGRFTTFVAPPLLSYTA